MQVGHLVVCGDAPGIRIVEIWDHIGMRVACSHDVLFESVPVVDEHISTRPLAEWQPASGHERAVQLREFVHAYRYGRTR